MDKAKDLQDVFLEKIRDEHLPVTLTLISGFQFKGTITGFDSFSLIIDGDGHQTLVYKHAVSSITPAKRILHDAKEDIPQL